MDVQVEKESGSGITFPPGALSLDQKEEKMKGEEIVRACYEGNLKQLVQLASSPGGLLDDVLRKSACMTVIPSTCRMAVPLTSLQGQSCSAVSSSRLGPGNPIVPYRNCLRIRTKSKFRKMWIALSCTIPIVSCIAHQRSQLQLTQPDESAKSTDARKKELYDLITQTLRSHPKLCYFQGYHDIVQVIMLVLGRDAASPAVESISLLRIRDYMLPSLTPALKHLQLVPCILQSADKELAQHLSLPHPNYALPAAITLYAHEIQEYSDIARLFDFLLAHEPVISLYLFAAIIISRRSSLLEIPTDEHDMLFFTLQKLPQPLDLESWINHALKLFDDHPPERLPRGVWRRMPSSSVLKTSRLIEHPESIATAEKHLLKQTEEVRWDEKKQKAMHTAFRYRRPLVSTALAVAIGAVSIWLRRSGNDRVIMSFVLSAMGWARDR